MPSFQLRTAGTAEAFTVEAPRFVVAGYTGRDTRAVDAHIAELAAIGVPPPPSVPSFYDLDPGLLTTDPVVEVAGDDTSGEAEPVLVRHAGRYYLGVGSDHTDRDLERSDVAASKAACPKPLSDRVVALPEELSTFDWDSVVIESSVDGATYQRDVLAKLRAPSDLLGALTASLGEVPGDLVVFAGTVPLLDGELRSGTRWQVALHCGEIDLTCSYETKCPCPERRNP